MDFNEMFAQQELVNQFITWMVFIILPAFAGSYASDYLKTLKHQEMKISLVRILLSAVIACIIAFIFVDWLIEINKKPILPFATFVLGMLGFEILHGFSSLDNMVALLKKLTKVMAPIVTIVGQINEVRKMSAKLEAQKKDGETDAGEQGSPETGTDNQDKNG
jgi:uncharacterized protein YacL